MLKGKIKRTQRRNQKILKKPKLSKQNDYKNKHKRAQNVQIKKRFYGGKGFRTHINRWSFYKFQFMLEYKLAWKGLSCEKIDAKNTSSQYSVCGGNNSEEGIMIWCTNCGFYYDRDKNSSVNILGKGLGFSLNGPAEEDMVRDMCRHRFAQKTSVDAGQNAKNLNI